MAIKRFVEAAKKAEEDYGKTRMDPIYQKRYGTTYAASRPWQYSGESDLEKITKNMREK